MPGGHVVLQMVSPTVAEHSRTIKVLGAQMVQLIPPLPGHVTPAGHGSVQLVAPGADQVLTGQKSCEKGVGHW